MNGNGQNLPYLWQMLGLIATLMGTGVGTAGLVWAIKAASRAKGAQQAAELARQAAVRAGRIAQLGDLIADMQELQAMLARMDFPAIAGKANLLRGRVVRFKSEAYNESTDEEKENLDRAREQLEKVVRAALTSRGKDQNKASRIQIGYGIANDALNEVVGIHAQEGARGQK